jgi:hypothetical protein
MRLFLIFIINCFIVQSDDFIKEVSNDFNMNSNFLVLDIKSKEYNGTVIIENDNLYLYYYKIYHKDKDSYRLFVKSILKKESFINIGNENLDKFNFIKVQSSKKIDNNFKKGLNNFIKNYFNNGNVLKNKVTDEEQNYIVKLLFENEIATFIDDETGYLLIKKR